MGSLTLATLAVLFPLLVVLFVAILLLVIPRRRNRSNTTALYTPTMS